MFSFLFFQIHFRDIGLSKLATSNNAQFQEHKVQGNNAENALEKSPGTLGKHSANFYMIISRTQKLKSVWCKCVRVIRLVYQGLLRTNIQRKMS